MSLSSSLVFLTKLVLTILPLFSSILLQTEAAASTPLVLYNFNAGSGDKVYDVSGNGAPLDLVIRDTNNIRWMQDGGLAVDRPTQIAAAGSAHKITDAIKASNAFTIETWIQPASKKQNGPARIVTLSADTLNRNMTIGQNRNTYEMRLRTTQTNDNGTPSLNSSKGTLDTNLTHIVYTRSSKGVARLYLNGVLQSRKREQGDLGSWDSNYGFALANELTGDRPWTGNFYQVAIYSQQLSGKEIDKTFNSGLIGGESASSSPAGPNPTDNTDSNNTTSSDSTNTTSGSTSLKTGSVSLGWNAPVSRSDGEALAMNEISGYTIYYGTAAGQYPNSVTIKDAYTTSTTITELPVGTYHFVVTARDSAGRESSHSSVATKLIDS